MGTPNGYYSLLIPAIRQCYARAMENWLNTHISLPVYSSISLEKENAYSHLAGLLLALLGFIWVIAVEGINPGMAVFAASNVIMYASSFLYHQLPTGALKRLMRIMDHSSIYILIAGSYTPVLLYMGTPLAYGYAAGMWIAALLGIFLTTKYWGKLYVLHIALYAAMGWSILSVWPQVYPLLPDGLFPYLIAGGITYTSGILFYGMKRIPHNHFIWHLFVLAGSIIFFAGYAIFLI